MALPTIAFNSSTGSDTAASGAGPGTALTGTGAATTAATNTVDLSADSPNLSGVATDGSAVLYVNSSSGRKFSKITNVNNGTKIVTCQDNFANTESGKTWAIGGKRATLAGQAQLGSDIYEGWTLSFEDDASLSLSAQYDFTPTASATDGKLTIQGNSTSTRRVCTNSANAANFRFSAAVQVAVNNIQFKCSNATRTAANALSGNASCNVTANNCIFGDPTNKLNSGCVRASGTPIFLFINCEFKNTIAGSCSAATPARTSYRDCWAHDGTSHGFNFGTASGGQSLEDCLSTANGGDGVNCGTTANIVSEIKNSTIHGNTGDGVDISGAAQTGIVVLNNNITANGGVGFSGTTSSNNQIGYHGSNNYGTGATANTGGAYSNITAGPGDLTVDPQYTNVGANDFSVGTNVKAKGFPDATLAIGANQSGTFSNMDIGVSQRLETGGSPGNVWRLSGTA